MEKYTEDLEKRNEELSEALEGLAEVNKDLLTKFITYTRIVQESSTAINANIHDICGEVEDDGNMDDESKKTMNCFLESSKRIIQSIKDKSHETQSKLLEMYKEI